LKRSDEQLKEVRHLLEKTQINQNKVILSEAEKRERRAMERKLSEMEEELKVSRYTSFIINLLYMRKQMEEMLSDTNTYVRVNRDRTKTDE